MTAAGASPRPSTALAVASLPLAVMADQTNLQLTNGIVWVLVGLSTAGAIVTFAYLVYALWKFRDKEADRRPYG